MKKKLQQTIQKCKGSWAYYEQLYSNKIDNLEEMDKFLEKYNLPKLNQEEIEKMNRPIISLEIETVIKNISTNERPGPDGYTGEFYQKFREELTPLLLKLFQKISQEGKLQNSFWVHHHPDTKTKNVTKKRKYQANITYKHRDKNHKQKSSKQNQQYILKDHTSWSNGLYHRDARILQYTQINQCDTPHL